MDAFAENQMGREALSHSPTGRRNGEESRSRRASKEEMARAKEEASFHRRSASADGTKRGLETPEVVGGLLRSGLNVA